MALTTVTTQQRRDHSHIDGKKKMRTSARARRFLNFKRKDKPSAVMNSMGRRTCCETDSPSANYETFTRFRALLYL